MAECAFYDNCNHKDCDKEFCLRRYKLEALYGNSLLSEGQRRHVTLVVDGDGTDLREFERLAEISRDIERFVADGENLFLHSNRCGNGKSSWAIRMIESYFDKAWYRLDVGCRAMFVSVPKFLLSLKDNISSKNAYATFVKDHIYEADLVVWDDIAAKAGTEFEINNLLSFIDARISAGKSNIYTSNMNRAVMAMALGERIASRLGYKTEDIELNGRDKRGYKAGGDE